jgi:hypothetical protein
MHETTALGGALLSRRTLLVTAGALLAATTLPVLAAGTPVTVHKTPWCGCCAAWAQHLKRSGFAVTIEEAEDLAPVKRLMGVPEHLQSCHTAVVEGYVIEGHVPAEDIFRLLEERPELTGLAVPGMPMGSPGMEGATSEAYDVIAFGPQGETVYRHVPA